MPFTSSTHLQIALDVEGNVRHVDSVANGAACNCTCPACGQPLIARNGGTRQAHHFAHRSGSCPWAVEAAITHALLGFIVGQGGVCIDAAGFWDSVEQREVVLDPAGWIAVEDARLVEMRGRQAPCLLVEGRDGSGNPARFMLGVVVVHDFTEAQLARVSAAEELLAVLDFAEVHAVTYDAEGELYSPSRFLVGVQRPEYLRSVVAGKRGFWDWLVHPARDRAFAAAEARWGAILDADFAVAGLNVQTSESFQCELDERREEKGRQDAEVASLARMLDDEWRYFTDMGARALAYSQHGDCATVRGCPIHGDADLERDCGGTALAGRKCIFYEGKGLEYIACSAARNGIVAKGR